MSAAKIRIAAARGEAEAARDRLAATIEEIKHRLAPRTLAQDAWAGAKEKGTEVADQTLAAAKERPALVAGVATGAALLIARKPLWRLVAGLFDRSEKTEAAPAKSKRKPATRPRKPRTRTPKE